MTHLGHHGDEFITGAAERVADVRRDRGFSISFDDAVGFQVAQLRREHLFAYAGKKIAKLGEASRPKAKVPNHERFPLAA